MPLCCVFDPAAGLPALLPTSPQPALDQGHQLPSPHAQSNQSYCQQEQTKQAGGTPAYPRKTLLFRLLSKPGPCTAMFGIVVMHLSSESSAWCLRWLHHIHQAGRTLVVIG